jgi:hypothetical protein
MPMSVLSPFSDRERVTANNIDSGKDKIIGLSMILPFGLPIMSAFGLCLFIEHIHLRVCSVAIRIVHLLENQRYFAVIYHLTVAGNYLIP